MMSAFPLVDAGDTLVQAAHAASYNAGWWHGIDGDPGSAFYKVLDFRTEARIRSRFGIAIVNEKIALIHSEVSEALEGFRKDKADEHLPHRKSIEVELADAVIRIADLAGALQLDLGAAIADKMAYNAQRADHKPEARAAVGGKAF
jgi:NTP pyrophosphatase (non-canonical NTP hydrolase)